MRGLRLDEGGHLETVQWVEGESLEALQEAVGGWVDVVQLTPQVSMWVNDEGMHHCKMSRPATRITALHGALICPIFGPVVFTGCRGFENETVSLPAAADAWLRSWAAGRCTCIEQREDRTVACGSVQGHPGVSHEQIVGEMRWIWHGAPSRSMDDLVVAE